MNFLFEKRKQDVFSEVEQFEDRFKMSLPLDYKLFISFFELEPTLLKFDRTTGIHPNNPNQKSIVLKEPNEKFIHVFPDLTDILRLTEQEFMFDSDYLPIGSPYVYPNGVILLSLVEKSYGKIFHTTWDSSEPVENEGWTLLANNFGTYINSFEIIDQTTENLTTNLDNSFIF